MTLFLDFLKFDPVDSVFCRLAILCNLFLCFICLRIALFIHGMSLCLIVTYLFGIVLEAAEMIVSAILDAVWSMLFQLRVLSQLVDFNLVKNSQ